MKNKNDKKELRRGGFYWMVNGEGEERPFVSVTNVLKVIDKPALRYWFGKQVYWAMVKNPALGEQEAMSAPYNKSKEAMARGTAVHTIVEEYKEHKNLEDALKDIPVELHGYTKAFISWVQDNDVEVVENEKTVVSAKYGYAGTMDLIVKVNKRDAIWIVDVKTGKDIYPEAFIQLSAYKQAMEEEGKNVEEIAVLLLMEDGKYKFQKGSSVFEVFLNTKALWEWLNKELLWEVNYKGGELNG